MKYEYSWQRDGLMRLLHKLGVHRDPLWDMIDEFRELFNKNIINSPTIVIDSIPTIDSKDDKGI